MKRKLPIVLSSTVLVLLATMTLASCDPNANETGIVLEDLQLSLRVGQVTKITLKDSVAGVTSTNVTYTSSNTDVATVDKTGLVTGLSEGKATITVTADLGEDKTATKKVDVEVVDSLDALDGMLDEVSKGYSALNVYLETQD